MIIPEITEFQLKSLEDVANAECPNYMLVRPDSNDPLELYQRWTSNNRQTDELAALGYVEDITHQFRRHVEESVQQNGRDFRVFRITDLGILLFRASRTAAVN